VKPWSSLICAAGVLMGVALAGAMLTMPEPAIRLARPVLANLPATGVGHPVTAVLLNYRGYDTLLEVVVLLLASLGMIAGGGARSAPLPFPGRPLPQLQLTARAIVPLMILVAGYLLWAGAHSAGGAFQAGAILAAALVLLYLAGVIPAWAAPGPLLRAGLAGGILLFLVVAALPSPDSGLLHYPPRLAGTLILLVEAGLTLSLGLVLAALFLWLPREQERPG
jgi:multisubunit Na+/H+ antiporter MnhB subunit